MQGYQDFQTGAQELDPDYTPLAVLYELLN